jgi:RNA polymerase sigma-70 factor (ECF subfamily)
LKRLDRQKGRFRWFLLAYLKNFLLEKRRNARTQKRGGGQVFISIDATAGQEGYLLEPVDELT